MLNISIYCRIQNLGVFNDAVEEFGTRDMKQNIRTARSLGCHLNEPNLLYSCTFVQKMTNFRSIRYLSPECGTHERIFDVCL